MHIRMGKWPLVFVAILLWIPPIHAQADLIGDVRAQLAQNSFPAAESELKNYKSQHGVTSEYLEAVSWMARGAASTKQWDQATAYASETRRLCEKQLTERTREAHPPR